MISGYTTRKLAFSFTPKDAKKRESKKNIYYTIIARCMQFVVSFLIFVECTDCKFNHYIYEPQGLVIGGQERM